jgi:hypothetical protein
MGKYEPLRQFLRKHHRERVAMTFAEIEKVVGSKLPASKQHRAWWSNNPDNNVMTREWLEAGYETESVDIAGGKLVFRRKAGASGKKAAMPSIHGCMKGMFTLAEGFDVTAPMDLEDDWYKKYESNS